MDYFTIPPLLTSADFYYDQIKSTTHRKGFISMLKDTLYNLLNRETQFDSFLDENGVFIWETQTTDDEDMYSNYAYENCGYYEN